MVARFEQSPGDAELGWLASQILDFKWGYLDADLRRWDPNDIAEILLGLYPAKVILDTEDLGTVVKGFASFLRFLGAEGVLAIDESHALGDLADALEPEFRSAALDERNWSMGKRLWNQAQSEGVDIADPDSVQGFMDDFNARPFLERDTILGPPPGLDASSLETTLVGALPPVVLPPVEELEEAAAETVVFSRLRRLVDYVGDGRALTGRGNLKLADGEVLVDLLETEDRFNPVFGDRVFKTVSTTELAGVDLTYRLALATRMLIQKGKKVVPGPNVDWVGDPLAAIYGAWLGLLRTVGPTQYFYGDDTYGWGWFAENFDEAIPMFLVDLYRDGETPIEEGADRMWDYLANIYELDDFPQDKIDFHQDLVRNSLRWAFSRLAELGSVEVSGVTTTPTSYGGAVTSGGTVGLTPLGKWAVQRFASRITSAPVVGELRYATARDLLEAVSDIPEQVAIAEIDVWIDHHGEEAALELVEALPGADETGRGLAFRALLRIGPRCRRTCGESRRSSRTGTVRDDLAGRHSPSRTEGDGLQQQPGTVCPPPRRGHRTVGSGAGGQRVGGARCRFRRSAPHARSGLALGPPRHRDRTRRNRRRPRRQNRRQGSPQSPIQISQRRLSPSPFGRTITW